MADINRIKIMKYVEDPCFGQKFKENGQCEFCWIQNACSIRFKNRKDK